LREGQGRTLLFVPVAGVAVLCVRLVHFGLGTALVVLFVGSTDLGLGSESEPGRTACTVVLVAGGGGEEVGGQAGG
jgi:hypothetical protein